MIHAPLGCLQILDDWVVVVGQVLHSGLVNDKGEDLDDPVVKDIAHQRVAAVPESRAHSKVGKSLT